MVCNNKIEFKNTILLPEGFNYLDVDPKDVLLAVNTKNLTQELVPVTKLVTIPKGVGVCESSEVLCEAKLVEVRLSGYLDYSLSVKHPYSDANFKSDLQNVDTTGCVTVVDRVALSSIDTESTNKAYIVCEHITANKEIDIEVRLTELDIVQVSDEATTEPKYLTIRGVFEFNKANNA